MANDVFILTGAIGTGKTTRLIDWALNQKKLKGIATPVIRDKRMFFDFETQAVFPMEITEGELDVLEVGRYRFSAKAFRNAISIVEAASMTDIDFLVIDEIGPMEMRGEGFDKIVKKILKKEKRNFNLVLVIRESIFKNVILNYNIQEHKLLEI
jgi:nucleoside-triphosphatase THEP1